MVPQDQAEAMAWYDEAARQGDAKALFKLGEAYERGRGEAVDPVQAMSWYTLAEEQGYERASERVARLGAALDPAATQAAAQQADLWRRDHGAH